MSFFNESLEYTALKTVLSPENPYAGKLVSLLKLDYFYSPVVRSVFTLAQDLLDSGALELPPYQLLLQDPNLSEGEREIAESRLLGAEEVKDAGGLEYTVKQLLLYAKIRGIYKATYDVASSIHDIEKTESEFQNLTDNLNKAILDAEFREDLHQQMTLGKGYNQEAEDSYFRVLNDQVDYNVLKWGWREFDERTGGFRRGNLVLMGANTGGGKSQMALNTLIRQYRMGYNTVLASYEMQEDEIMIRLLSNISEVDMSKIYNKKCSPAELRRIDFAYREFNLLGHANKNTYTILCPKGSTTVNDIGMRVRTLRPGILILDYINFLYSSNANADSQWQELGEIAREGKLLAKKLDCVVVLLVQLNDVYELRYSKSIKDHADFLMGWIRGEDALADRLIEIRQLKARNAPLYNFTLEERFDLAQFRDPGQEDRQDWPDDAAYYQFLDLCQKEGLVLGSKFDAKVASGDSP